ncbi:MAG TPA: S8 family serine peptidase, partial [Thermoanaerobaculia bacterium]|nr:S8 family serine peptidase [Thermoanaerobaculia bacterium]
HGEGQIIAILDTGLAYDSCYFAEPDGSAPPFNTGSPTGGLDWQNVDYSRRKVIAYDFLWDDPDAPDAYDNFGHGTHAAGAAAGDRGVYGVHDLGDAIAPMAKLVIQDAGVAVDNCTQLPGIGCPVSLTSILDQAYRQGVRIHSNSWGDRQGVPPSVPPPTANYPASAREVDNFIWTHPEMLIVFNTGNNSLDTFAPAGSLSAPGCAKNTIQVAGTREVGREDDSLISSMTRIGPTRDGRIKPDLLGPAVVLAGDIDTDKDPNTCDLSYQTGTSWASPTIAGAAALVRQYYTDGFYPSGSASSSDRFTPSAALMKATLIAAARPAVFRSGGVQTVPAAPVPSGEQGWGFPVLDDALYFPGDTARMRVNDVPFSLGLTQGETANLRIPVKGGAPLKIVLVWTDPPGTVSNDTTPQLVNDLDLLVTTPTGTTRLPNNLTKADRLNNVEVVTFPAPFPGTYSIDVTAHHLGQGVRQNYALVVTGDLSEAGPRRRAARH